jgi:hypothetical protein
MALKLQHRTAVSGSPLFSLQLSVIVGRRLGHAENYARHAECGPWKPRGAVTAAITVSGRGPNRIEWSW